MEELDGGYRNGDGDGLLFVCWGFMSWQAPGVILTPNVAHSWLFDRASPLGYQSVGT